MKRKKPFHVKKRRILFSKGPVCWVDCTISMPDGRAISRQILEHPGAVVMIPQIRPGCYLLIRQFRFAARDWLWEFPAGGIERGESLKAAATRELIEECGVRPRRLTPLVHFYPTPGISGEIMYLYLAEDLVPEYAAGDEDEAIEKREFSLAEIGAMIRQGKIIDGKTLLGFCTLAHLGFGKGRPQKRKS